MTDLIPAARPVPSPEDRMADARTDTAFHRLGQQAAAIIQPAASFATYLDATERDQLDARAACAEGERDDALQDRDHWQNAHHQQQRDLLNAIAERDEALEARDVAKQLADFRQGVIDRHRQELGAAGEVLAVVRDAAERIDRALATYDTTPGEPEHFARLDGTCWADCPGCSTPTLGSADRRAQEPTAGEARRLLDQAIDTALPLAGRSVRKLLKALRRELARVDSGRAPAGDPA